MNFRLVYFELAVLLPPLLCGGLSAREFVHPGLLHSKEDLAFVKEKVSSGAEPWKTAWTKMQADKQSALTWIPRPVEKVVRGPINNPDIGSSALSLDSGAAYCHALEWVITGEKAHAQKAIEILNAWSYTLAAIEGHDQKLLAGITAHRFCNAAEILRYTHAGWQEKDIEQFKTMLLSVYYPLLKDFFPEANGNWDASMINSMLCIGVFCDDSEKFERASDYFLHGKGNGSIARYIFPSGQCQESTRDQAHTQLGLGMLAAACEVAAKQGIDLYGAEDNRLALGFEYTAKYNLGEEVPCKGKISDIRRGDFRPIYEQVYRHYANEKSLEMPYTKKVLEKIRPEGASRDHTGWGTLLFYRGDAVK